MPDYRIAYRPFPQQQAYFRRKVNMPSARWDDLMHGEHAHGFMAAGVARADVLDDLRRAVQAAIDDGEGFDAFRARFDDILTRHGWIGGAGNESQARRAWRMRIIYQTNLRTSYMAGRWEQLQAFPYMRYQHNTVKNPRHEHQAWDGLVLATNDPWWDTHYPPNGWGCACTVTGVGKGRMRALGKNGPDPTPGPSAGDPPTEWAYHPGKAARSLSAAESFGRKVMALPAQWRKIALDDAQRRSVNWFADWPGLVERVDAQMLAGAPRAIGMSSPIGFLPALVASALAAGQSLNDRAFVAAPAQTALVAATDRALFHSLRDDKFTARPGLRTQVLEVLRELPEWVAKSDAVLWDPFSNPAHPVLWFARRQATGNYLAVAVRPDYRERRADQPLRAAWVRTVEEKSPEELLALPLILGAVR